MTPGPTSIRNSHVASRLLAWARRHDVELAARLPAELRQAEQIVAVKLAAALRREGLAPSELAQPFHHDVGFARAVAAQPRWRGVPLHSPALLLHEHPTLATAHHVQADVDNCVANLALTCAAQRKRGQLPDTLAMRVMGQRDTLDPTTANLLLDQLNVMGHNVHPFGRLRRGMSPTEALAYAAECQPDRPVMLRFVAVRTELLRRTAPPGAVASCHLGEILEIEFPQLAAARQRLPDAAHYGLVPLHPWQYEHVLFDSYSRELADGDIVALSERLPVTPTTSLRTLVTGPSRSGRRCVLKTAVNVWLTSTRRDISPATTINGPAISRVLAAIVAADPWLRCRVSVLGELAGSCFAPPGVEHNATRLRGLSTVLRADLTQYVAPGQLAVSASSLCADSPLHERTLLAHIVASIAANRVCDISTAARIFLDRYTDCLATSMVVLLTGYGIGLEAHLQNTLVLLDTDDVPRRLLLRDFGGIRIHLPRLAAAGYRYSAHPGGVTTSRSIEPVRSKAYYACLQANLAEIVLTLVSQCGLDADCCWRGVWDRLNRAWEYVAQRLDVVGACAADRDVMSESTALQKAFVTMACNPDAGDHYVEVPNPLHDAARKAHTVPRP